MGYPPGVERCVRRGPEGSCMPTSTLPDDPTPDERREHSLRLRTRAVRGGAVLMAARLFVQVLAWSVTLIVARLLTPYDYGVMSIGVVFICLAEILAEAGVGRALVQKEELGPEDLAAAFTINMTLAAVLYGLLVATSGLVADAMDTPEV